ncbi:hypothetical protein COW53_02845, partial [bacterium CG17_big_fil_post_rev_8_21_14_2_50_64_8]
MGIRLPLNERGLTMLPRSSLHGALTAVSLLLAPLTAHASAGGYSVGPVTAVVDSALTALVSS